MKLDNTALAVLGREFAMRGAICGSRAALYEGGLLLRMTQDTTIGGMRTPSRLELFQRETKYKCEVSERESY